MPVDAAELHLVALARGLVELGGMRS